MVILLNFQSKNFVISSSEQINDFLRNQRLQNYSDEVFFTSNGKIIPVELFSSLKEYSTIMCSLKLKGGKGGFGAKLKTEGGKKVRPNDNMFSRDISGRRISYAMAEKEYSQFCKRKNEEDQKVKKEREQFKIFQSTLKEGQSFTKLDKKYNEQLQETEKTLQSSFKIGLQKLKNQRLQNLDKQENSERIVSQYEKQGKLSLIDKFYDSDEEQFDGQKIYKVEKQQVKQPQREKIQVVKQVKRFRPQSLQKQQKLKQDKLMNLREEPVKLVKIQTPIESSARNKLKSLFKK